MTFSPLALAFQIANFLVLVWILKRWLYQPFLAAVDARREALQSERNAVAQAKTEAQDALANAERARREIEARREGDLASAKAEAVAERNRIIEVARGDAQARIEAAQARIATERQAASAAVQAEAVEIGVDLAARMLAALPSAVLDGGFAQAVDEWLSGLDAARRRALFAAGGQVRVYTASRLDERNRQAWIDIVRRQAASAAEVAFETRPAVGGGVELDLPGGNLRFSLRSAAEDIRRAAKNA